MEHVRNFDKQNYDKSIVDYIGETLEKKISRENFYESPIIRQIRHGRLFHC